MNTCKTLTNRNSVLALGLLGLGIVILSSGCSTNRCRSWSLRDMWANRPTPVRNYFTRGQTYSTCNPPVGQLSSYSENYAPGCENGSCGSPAMSSEQPIYNSVPGAGVPYYPSDAAPAGMIGPTSSNNLLRTNFPPAFDANEFGSGLQSVDSSALRTNVELETPPMYGSGKGF